jgi:excisionase family DNA binding protein
MDNATGSNNEPEPLRGIDALCQFLGMPKKSVYKWTSNRHSGFPFYKVGKHLKFRFSEVNFWLRKYRASEGAREFSRTPQPFEGKKTINIGGRAS